MFALPLGAYGKAGNGSGMETGNGKSGGMLGWSGGMLPQEILVILGVLRCIVVHSETYREAHRAS